MLQLQQLYENEDKRSKQEIEQKEFELSEKILALLDNEGKTAYKYYPSVNDPYFTYKLLQFKEFNQNMMPHIQFQHDTARQQYEQEVNKVCRIEENGDIERSLLMNHQKMLRNFISPHTPYNSLLVYHGVGVGKTCTTISIAEQFKRMIFESQEEQQTKKKL